MKRNHIVSLLLAVWLVLPLISAAQPGIKIRLGGNLSRIVGEIQGDDLLHPDIDSFNSDSTKNILQDIRSFSPGFEFEVMYPLSNRIYVGLELNRMQLSGNNDEPPQYNFQLDPEFNALRLQIRSTEKYLFLDEDIKLVNSILDTINFMHQGPIKYKTNLANLLLNLRVYLIETGRVRPYGKLHGGISLLSTELIYNYGDAGFEPGSFYSKIYDNYFSSVITFDPDSDSPDDEIFAFNGRTLYSRGLPTSLDKTRQLALNVGAGAGVEVQVASRISLMAGVDYSLITSGLVDGRPNLDYIEPDIATSAPERFELRNPLSGVTRFSIGLVYSFGEGFTSGGGSRSNRGSGGSGRASGNLPFYKPYSR